MSKSKFVFYSKSADKYPGSGAHETLAKGDNFSELNLIKDWRKKLSNMHISPFELGNKQWCSVENFFHSAKFMKDFPNFADTFTLDSGSRWSNDPFLAKSAGKAGRVSPKGAVFKHKDITIPRNVKMRDDFYQGIDRKAMILAFYSKFTQNEDLRDLLLKTGDAELYHLITIRGKQSELQRWDHLETVRECIKRYPDRKISKEVVNRILG